MSVLVIGDIVTDVLVLHDGPIAAGSDTAARIRSTGGGSAANTAAWLAAAGVDVALVGVVGEDPAGAARVAELEAAGVRCHVRVAPGATTGSVVVLSYGNERTMLCDRGANALLNTLDIERAPPAERLHVSGYVLFDPRTAMAGCQALAAARGTGRASVDAASAEPLRRLGPERFLSWVRGADLLLANLAEARVLAGTDGPPAELAERLTTYTTKVVVKCGADGAVWADRDGVRTVAAEPAQTVDVTGAGDAFAAGLLAALVDGTAPEPALRAAARLGARAVTTLGGRPVAA